jgi:hypothetical protein
LRRKNALDWQHNLGDLHGVSDTVIVAAPEHLPALQEQGDFGEALAFTDADALKALEAITRDRPKIIALERQFAATSRGAALIKRIKADPKLKKCEIRIVSQEGTDAAPSAEPPVSPETPTVQLDYRGTRRAPRVKVVEGIEVLIDGSPAALVDLSVAGAQVLSPTILRPNQRVRMILPDDERPIRCVAGVAWAAFEMPKSGPRYRAGIEFFDAETGDLDRFIELNKLR